MDDHTHDLSAGLDMIEQGTRILMARHGLGAEGARAMLREWAQARGSTMTQLGRELVRAAARAEGAPGALRLDGAQPDRPLRVMALVHGTAAADADAAGWGTP